MKKIIALVLTFSLLLVACAPENTGDNGETRNLPKDDMKQMEIPVEEMGDDTPYEYHADFVSLNDEDLFRYVQDSLYNEMVNAIDSDQYVIDGIEITYISKEFIQELDYNSRKNIFFGYTLAELDEYFQGQKYVFTLGDDGQTTVKAFEGYDDTFEKALKNVAIGSGVILVCATVSLVSGGLGAPAVSMIFAASAKTGATCALSMGALGGIAAGAVTGIQTKDMSEALKAAALSGSEGFKWGAIIGSVSGGANEAIGLKQATKNGLTMNEVAVIQKESKYPLDVIGEIHNMDEYQALKVANAKPVMLNGKTALLRQDIDLKRVDEYGRTNLQRMQEGLAPLDSTGVPIELHHVGQSSNGTLITLTKAEHDNSALHGFKTTSEIDRNEFAKIRREFWKSVANIS